MRPRDCVDCKRPMRPGKTLARNHPGTVVHQGRGLCATCYDKRHETGTLSDFELHQRRWDHIVDDYELLRSEGYGLRDIADRLGMTFEALDKTLGRHKSDPRARRPPQIQAARWSA